MNNTIFKNKKIHQATLLVYKGSNKVTELSKGEMTGDSPFAIASISKLYTDALIFWLIDQQRLSYDSRLTDLLPEATVGGLPNAEKVIVRHLVDQTSGFANYEMDKLSEWHSAVRGYIATRPLSRYRGCIENGS